MLQRELTILNCQGMHARPAMQIVEIASRYKSNVRIRKGNLNVDAKSIMQVMTLEATMGTVLTFEAEGDDAQPCLDALEVLIAEKFNED